MASNMVEEDGPLARLNRHVAVNLPPEDYTAFQMDFTAALGKRRRDVSRVHWAFLASELRALPPVEPETRAVVAPVITGMDLLSSGEPWADAGAARRALSGWKRQDLASRKASAWAAEAALRAEPADGAVDRRVVAAAEWAASAVDQLSRHMVGEAVAHSADWCLRAGLVGEAAPFDAFCAAIRRQRDTLLRLVREAA